MLLGLSQLLSRQCLGAEEQEISHKLSCTISSKAYTSHSLSIAAGYQHLAYQALFPCESHDFRVYCSFMMRCFGLITRTNITLELSFDLLCNIRILLDDRAHVFPRRRRPCADRDEACRRVYEKLHVGDSSVLESR